MSGSFALAGRPALRDSTVAAKLRAGGAVPVLPLDYTRFVDRNRLRGMRIGVTRHGIDDVAFNEADAAREMPWAFK